MGLKSITVSPDTPSEDELKSDHFGIEIIFNCFQAGPIHRLKSDHFGIEIYPFFNIPLDCWTLKSDHFGIEINHHNQNSHGIW